jgi:hypothetical protein
VEPNRSIAPLMIITQGLAAYSDCGVQIFMRRFYSAQTARDGFRLQYPGMRLPGHRSRVVAR